MLSLPVWYKLWLKSSFAEGLHFPSSDPNAARCWHLQDFLHAKMRADAAERTHMDSAREVAKASAVKDLVLAARNALQRGPANEVHALHALSLGSDGEG